MAATLKTVAEACGVSAQTVSRVLNSKYAHLYKEATRNLVLSKAKELDYRPNAAAQAMKSGNFKSILLLQSSNPTYSHVTSSLFYSIQTTLAGFGYKLICSILPEEQHAAEAEMAKILNESFVDGILVGITRLIPEWLEQLFESRKVPVFWIGSQHEQNCICHNDFQSAYDITTRFIELGHKKIAYADYLSTSANEATWHFSAHDRMNGYKKAMLEAGLQERIVRPETVLSADSVVEYSEEMLLKSNRPTAILTYGLTPTHRAITYALCRNGIRVPDDVSLATFDYSPVVENDIKMATYIPSRQDVGKIAAELVYDKIQNKDFTSDPIVLPFDLVEGNSIKQCRN